MDYRFSLTPRLMAVGAFCLVALLALVFALGVAVGQRMAPAPAPVAAGAAP